MEDLGILRFDSIFFHEIIFVWLSATITAFIMYKLLYNPVKTFLKNRQDKIAAQITSAEQQLKEAGELKAQYEEKLKNIDDEKKDILDKARKLGIEQENQIIQSAKTEAETIKNRANLDIQREQSRAEDEMKNQIIEVASLMASKFVNGSMDEATKTKLLDEAIADLGDVKWSN